MTLPTREEIIAEATKLFHQRNETECYNSPELCELREAGLLREAQRKLMIKIPSSLVELEIKRATPPDREVKHSSNYIVSVKTMEKQDWVEEWMKTDPYMVDIEGFEKFVQDKEKELRVQVTVDLSEEGFSLFVEVPSNQIPEEQKNETEVAQKEKQVQIITEQIDELLKQLGKSRELPLRDIGFMPDGEEKKAMIKKLQPNLHSEDKLRPGSVHVWLRPPLVCKPELCIADVERRKTRKYPYSEDDYEALWWKVMKEEWNNCEWVYSGDTHCGKDIEHNAKILWKIWNAIGKLAPTCFGIGKPYQCDEIYLYCYANISFPPFSPFESDIMHSSKESSDYGDEVHELNIETAELDDIGMQLNALGKTLSTLDIPNTDDIFRSDFVWILGEQPLPILAAYKANIPEVLSYLGQKEEYWDPENDDDVYRNGGIEIIHPFLRRELTLKWSEEDVIWSESAEECRRIFFTRYTESDLAEMKVEDLRGIASAKGIHKLSRKQDLIEEIIKANDRVLENVEEDEDYCDREVIGNAQF